MPKLPTLEDRRAVGAELSISGESHVVGEDDTNTVWLHEVPLEESPSTVTIPGYTEITTGSPADNQFLVHYSGRLAGSIDFNAADSGLTVAVTYKGRGSSAVAAWMNRVRSKLQGIRTLTDGANIAWDLATEQIGYVQLEGNRTLDNPTSMEEGLCPILLVAQDATGSRTLAYGTAYDFGTDGAPALTPTASKFDVLGFVVRNSKMVFTGIKKGFAV